uniref:Uncharacterized protein n=1 Tax=Sphaerodactylus townsendi TaxID=933632 RepID=A0ACB8EYR4_9SAUR
MALEPYLADLFSDMCLEPCWLSEMSLQGVAAGKGPGCGLGYRLITLKLLCPNKSSGQDSLLASFFNMFSYPTPPQFRLWSSQNLVDKWMRQMKICLHHFKKNSLSSMLH